MTLSRIQFLVAFVLLSNCMRIDAADWVSRLEHRRERVQGDVDLLIKYFCSQDQSDVNCQRRLPALREELRQIDEQLLGYRSGDRRKYENVLDTNHDHDTSELIRRRSYVQAEQEMLSQRSDVHTVVQTVYDNRIENFNLLVDFASALRNGELKFLIYKYLLEEIIRRGHDEPLRVVRLIRGLQDEVVLGNSIDDETHTKAANMVDSLKLLFESAVAKLWIDNSINHYFEMDINVAMLADEISTLDPDLFTRIISKVVAGVYPLMDTDNLMRNMEKFHLVPQLIDGYTAIHNEMARFNDINGKRYILKLGYYCKELIQRFKSTRMLLSPEKRTQLQILAQRLPVSIRSIVFSDRVCLKSKYVHDYLHIAHGHPYVQRYAIMAPGTQLKWIPKRIDYSVFFEFPYGGFLLVNDEDFDGRNRLVSASLNSEDMVSGSEWKIEAQGDDCLIRNVAFDELLYVSDEFDEDHRSNKVFTDKANPASAVTDDRFKWTIEEC